MYIYDWVTLLKRRKLTEDRKPAIMKKNKNKRNYKYQKKKKAKADI